MIWSFSADRMFRQCQRQWYYDHVLADWRESDVLRREAYLLSKLGTIAAWRGRLVDKIISEKIVQALKRKQAVNLVHVLRDARSLFDLQLAYARAHRLREPGFSATKAGDAFAAFASVEYGDGIREEEIGEAWKEIEQALTKFSEMADLRAILSASTHLIPQRALQSKLAGTSIKGIPDLVGFNAATAPIIFDWKVHRYGRADARRQLAFYAFCLAACKPHKDFPASQPRYVASDVRLLEIQLLTGQLREHRVTEADLDELEDYVATSALSMQLACGDGDGKSLRPEQFAVTIWPDTCRRCVFRKLCWEESHGDR